MNVSATAFYKPLDPSVVYRSGMQPPGNQVMASASSTGGYSSSFNPPPRQQIMFSPRQYSQALNSQTMNFTGNPPQPQNPDDLNANVDPNAAEGQPVLVDGSIDPDGIDVAMTVKQVPDYAAKKAEVTAQNGTQGDIMGSIAEQQNAQDNIPREDRSAEKRVSDAVEGETQITTVA